jgi:hypothetical protein
MLGQLINLIWLEAKSVGSTLVLRNELYAVLQRWKHDDFIDALIETSNVSKESAILSILIPAYVTMYRVVLLLIFHAHNYGWWARITGLENGGDRVCL